MTPKEPDQLKQDLLAVPDSDAIYPVVGCHDVIGRTDEGDFSTNELEDLMKTSRLLGLIKEQK